jgi:hypothetical protein
MQLVYVLCCRIDQGEIREVYGSLWCMMHSVGLYLDSRIKKQNKDAKPNTRITFRLLIEVQSNKDAFVRL